MATLMIHTPENFITNWDKVNKSEILRIQYINEIGQNGIEGNILILISLLFLGN